MVDTKWHFFHTISILGVGNGLETGGETKWHFFELSIVLFPARGSPRNLPQRTCWDDNIGLTSAIWVHGGCGGWTGLFQLPNKKKALPGLQPPQQNTRSQTLPGLHQKRNPIKSQALPGLQPKERKPTRSQTLPGLQPPKKTHQIPDLPRLNKHTCPMAEAIHFHPYRMHIFSWDGDWDEREQKMSAFCVGVRDCSVGMRNPKQLPQDDCPTGPPAFFCWCLKGCFIWTCGLSALASCNLVIARACFELHIPTEQVSFASALVVGWGEWLWIPFGGGCGFWDGGHWTLRSSTAACCWGDPWWWWGWWCSWASDVAEWCGGSRFSNGGLHGFCFHFGSSESSFIQTRWQTSLCCKSFSFESPCLKTPVKSSSVDSSCL